MKVLNRFRLVALSVTAVLGSAGAALAQAPTMPAVAEHIDYASIATALIGAGVAVLLIAYPVRIGFKFVHKLIGKMLKGV